MEESKQRIGFFKRLKTAIFKLEDYGFFLGENFKVSLKYFFLLVLILSVIISVVDVYSVNKMLNKGYEYLVNDLPEFTYEEGKVSFAEKVDAYDHEYGFKLLIDTSKDIDEEILKDYKNQIYNEPYGVIVLEDKFVYIANGMEAEYKYQEFFDSNALEIKNKEDLISVFAQTGISAVITTYFAMDLIIVYISNVITIFGDIAVIAIFGLIAARFCGLRFKTLPMVSISIYSLTLSIVLKAIYVVIYAFTGFVINYFDVMYLLIAYVYIIAAILMIKYDLIKQHFELEKILEVQKQVHEELKEQDEKEKDKEEKKEEEKNKDKNEEKKEEEKKDEVDVNNREPDGSEI